MKESINDDNKYAVGTIVCAKAFPDQKLVISQYKQRIYSCAVVDHPELKHFSYYERELVLAGV